MHYLEEYTIVAPATVPGTGALSLLRISGPLAITVCDKVIRFSGASLSDTPGGRLRYGEICNADGSLLDTVVVSVFRAPHSYTGEDSVEISCHASSYIVSRLLEMICASGARLAGPGEFTKRAFLNGKMDLSQAEAVADVISSNSEASHRVAMNQLRGGYSKDLESLRDDLVQMASLLELELDFSEEDVEFADRSGLSSLLDKVLSHINKLTDSFRLGNAIKNGIPVAIVGPVNAGKSTLLNTLLNEERAIVSDIAGTTRDTIEETVNIDGILFRFIDTAGLRETSEYVESAGIKRSLKKLSEADVVLAVIDLTAPVSESLSAIKEIVSKVDFSAQKLVILLNKWGSDDANKNVTTINNFVSSTGNKIVAINISALNRIGIDDLKNCLKEWFGSLNLQEDATLVTNVRHLEALKKAQLSLSAVATGLSLGSPTDLLAQDLREAISHISSILGQDITPDTVLHHIFAHHCIGK
ncbi:MAG: tRNA uridine-5-carboxymethylaminomethyl(34) synthesis GTPase MnmE [Bacteroidales bacterium]|nr:tRNA uridine-5-carboxymethylaminomethyl(34) synthesis GTPase MnmE [Bacteroidales bacterium]